MDKFRKSYEELSQGISIKEDENKYAKSQEIDNQVVNTPSRFSKIKELFNPKKIYLGFIIFIMLFIFLFAIKPSFIQTKIKNESGEEKKVISYKKLLLFSIILSSPYFIWFFTRKNN